MRFLSKCIRGRGNTLLLDRQCLTEARQCFLLTTLVLLLGTQTALASDTTSPISSTTTATTTSVTAQSPCNFTFGFLVSSVGEGALIQAAVPLALKDANARFNHFNQVITSEWKNTGDLGSADSIAHMTKWREEGKIAYIGPDENCFAEGLVAAAWNLPMISYKCSEQKTSDKRLYPTFARTIPPSSKVSKFVVALLEHYDWTNIVIVVGDQPPYQQIKEALVELVIQKKMVIHSTHIIPKDYSTKHQGEIDEIIRDTRFHTRVYVLIVNAVALIQFARKMYETEISSTGEYVIISVDDEMYNSSWAYQYLLLPQESKYIKDVPEKHFFESFRSVLKVALHKTNASVYEPFRRELKNIMTTELLYPDMMVSSLQIPIYAAYAYDAVMLYAYALEQVLRANEDPRNGTAIIKYIMNHTYESIQGYKVRIDEFGDSEGNYTVVALVAGDEPNGRKLQPVGKFVYDSNFVPKFSPWESVTIDWFGGEPPKNLPVCGFDGKLCEATNKSHWIIVIVGCGCASILLVAAFFVFRHYRYEHRLACLLWKIDARDLHVISETAYADDKYKINLKSLVKHFRKHKLQEVTNFTAVTGGYVLENIPHHPKTKIAIYKGTIVAVKNLNKKSIDLTRSIREELKDMRDVRHDNLVPFIGACIDATNIAIVAAYCSRGSLEDVLLNPDLKLDRMFIASLIADLIKGMTYLHDSVIQSHGHLKSSNCLVDSRWVLQVADYGLHEFKSTPDSSIDCFQPTCYKRFLWQAPELLRSPSCPSRGTMKGDVYAFGIILHEMICRKGPWGTSSISQKEIIERVSYPELYDGQILRPSLHGIPCHDSVRSCMYECWAQEPDQRPDFRNIHTKLKDVQSGLKLNIFDNMMVMMEKYAYNLEGLVEERTKQLTEEKKKTDSLLHRMLPKSVAEQLKRGEQVVPESFDCVTIYFSDIVGFTALSAESTPFQIVDLLNDLYTCFDHVIESYDAYKVETIGDAYMVVSGLPIRNGDRHAGQIARIALHLLSAIKTFKISHRPSELLKLRIGIHSGPCAAGVVGLKMPRYCLFGDTVNTASRMESTGEPLKIHVSEACKEILVRIGGFRLEERGLIQIKGKGTMRTFWLLGNDPYQPPAEVLSPTPPTSCCHLPFLSSPSVHPAARKLSASLPRIVESREAGIFIADVAYSAPSAEPYDSTPTNSLPGSPTLSSTRCLLAERYIKPMNLSRSRSRRSTTRRCAGNGLNRGGNMFHECKHIILKELRRNGHTTAVGHTYRPRSASAINLRHENFV